MRDAVRQRRQAGGLRHQVEPRGHVLGHVVEDLARVGCLDGRPRRSDLHVAVGGALGHRAEGPAGRAGDGAAELGDPAAAAGEGLGHPAPADVVQQRIVDEVGLERGPDEDDGAEGAVPLVDAVGIVQQDEPAGGGIRVGVGHLGGERHGGRCQPLRSGGLVELELGAHVTAFSCSRAARRRRFRRRSTSRLRLGAACGRGRRFAAPHLGWRRGRPSRALSSSLMWGTSDFLGGFTSRRIRRRWRSTASRRPWASSCSWWWPP